MAEPLIQNSTDFSITPKRMPMSEMGLFTVRNGKIAKEAFFYTM